MNPAYFYLNYFVFPLKILSFFSHIGYNRSLKRVNKRLLNTDKRLIVHFKNLTIDNNLTHAILLFPIKTSGCKHIRKKQMRITGCTIAECDTWGKVMIFFNDCCPSDDKEYHTPCFERLTLMQDKGCRQ